ncbi:MAG: AsmA family protein, partial [Muribaculaceae bacterium]|nr:AsmA family protein [Muribaculaceae bacterium]
MKKQQTETPGPDNGSSAPQAPDIQKAPAAAPRKRRLSRWISVPLRVIGCLLLLIVLIPVLLYIPPIQTAVKDAATKIVRDKTGMDIEISRFRLKFPLSVSLQGVKVIEASGDTMVNAGELLADVRMLPLFRGDIRLNALQLNQGYYRFLSPDSSMLIKIRAGQLQADNQSSMSLTQSRIMLNKVQLSDGD